MILLTYFKNMKYSKHRGNSYHPSLKIAYLTLALYLTYIEKVLNCPYQLDNKFPNK